MSQNNKSESKSSHTAHFNSNIYPATSTKQQTKTWVYVSQPIIKDPKLLNIIKTHTLQNSHRIKQKYKNLISKPPMRNQQLKVAYCGTWNKGKPEGFGRLIFDSGLYYEGELIQGELSGQGLYILQNKQFFKGQFKRNQPIGKAVFFGHQIKAQGIWQQEYQLVYGTVFRYSDETLIKMKNKTVGTIEYKNGVCYQGQIVNNQPEGHGKMIMRDGNSYTGQFKDKMFNGKGVYQWTSGFKYEGIYQNNLKNGEGKFYHQPKLIQECRWEKGVKTGLMKLYFQQKLLYSGQDQDQVTRLTNLYFNVNRKNK